MDPFKRKAEVDAELLVVMRNLENALVKERSCRDKATDYRSFSNDRDVGLEQLLAKIYSDDTCEILSWCIHEDTLIVCAKGDHHPKDVIAKTLDVETDALLDVTDLVLAQLPKLLPGPPSSSPPPPSPPPSLETCIPGLRPPPSRAPPPPATAPPTSPPASFPDQISFASMLSYICSFPAGPPIIFGLAVTAVAAVVVYSFWQWQADELDRRAATFAEQADKLRLLADKLRAEGARIAKQIALIGSGASIGTGIGVGVGSVVPVVGNLLGGAVGATVGTLVGTVCSCFL